MFCTLILTQLDNVKLVNCNVVDAGGFIKSFVPSNTILPPFAELNVGPFVNVPLFPLLLTSFQVVEPET